jgi:hypothetical protein
MFAALKTKDETVHTQTAQTRSGKGVARPPRPIEGNVDFDALITGAMKQYPKARARLAE